jgi:hypothetical protein
MQCLKEYQATDFHKIGNQYLLITKDRECLRLDREQKVLERKQMAPDELFKFKLIYHLAATMTGIKPVTIMRFKTPQPNLSKCANCKQRWRNISRHFQGIQTLGMRTLDNNQQGESLIFFHVEACRRLLQDPCVRAFLIERGLVYGRETVNDPARFIDWCLKMHKQKGSLPVEMGLFMGIPLKDVRGYISGRETPTMTVGWRMYGTPQSSLLLANLYRRLRQYAVMAFFKNSFEDIAARLGRSQLIKRIDLLAA